MKHSRSPLLVFAMLTGALPLARAQVYERIDVNSQGQPANLGAAYGGVMSDDGRFVVFVSDATNLGWPAAPGTHNLFVRDRQLGTTTRIPPTPLPGEPMQYGFGRISSDGSKITFIGTTPAGLTRTFQHVLATGTTTELSVVGLQNMFVESLNVDGRFGSITARTTTDPTRHVYRLDLATQTVVICSRKAVGVPLAGRNSDIDDDGTHVVFESLSSAIVPLDTNAAYDVFLFDVPHNAIECVSVGTNGVQGNAESLFPRITADGRYVSMTSLASNWAPAGSTGYDIFVRDLRLRTTTPMSLTTQGLPTHVLGAPSFPSADATSVAFVSLLPTGPADAPVTLDVFVRDNQMGALLPATPGNATNGVDSFAAGITSDGRQVLVFSYSQTLVSGVGPGYFIADFGPRCSTSGYCTSLPNSTGGAATISAQGNASRTLNNLAITGVGMPDTAIALVVSASVAVDPGLPFANGLLCIGGGMIRHGIHVASGGAILDAQDLNAPAYEGVNPGNTRYYQIFYRDPLAGGAQFNTTDGVAVTFCW